MLFYHTSVDRADFTATSGRRNNKQKEKQETQSCDVGDVVASVRIRMSLTKENTALLNEVCV